MIKRTCNNFFPKEIIYDLVSSLRKINEFASKIHSPMRKIYIFFPNTFYWPLSEHKVFPLDCQFHSLRKYYFSYRKLKLERSRVDKCHFCTFPMEMTETWPKIDQTVFWIEFIALKRTLTFPPQSVKTQFSFLLIFLLHNLQQSRLNDIEIIVKNWVSRPSSTARAYH